MTTTRRFDPADYAEEFRLLTSLGMRGADIIARCAPSSHWFEQNVKPVIEWAVCETCNSPFRVQQARSLTKCWNMCGVELASQRYRRLK